VAPSFARIFYRNAINIGLPILECDVAADAICDGDEVSIDFATGEIADITSGRTFQALPFPPFIQDIIDNDGLFNSLKAHAGA
jgi:3-isopropylmalate/(R)-2-methylmalate dehydratase small subunit